MSKVLVGRELLPCPFCGQQDAFVEQLDSDASVVICQGMVDEHSACLARGPVGVQQSDLEDQPGRDAAIAEWNRRAQPAEAEGAVPVVCYLRAFQDGTPHWTEDCVCEDAVYPNHDGDETYSMPMVRQADHLAALSAVTAERDGLAAARMAYANEFAPDENGDPDVGNVHANIRALKAERDRLDMECGRLLEGKVQDAETIFVLEAERDQLRAEVEMLREDAERFRHIERDCDSGMRGIYGDDWVEVIDGYIAEYADMAAKEE